MIMNMTLMIMIMTIIKMIIIMPGQRQDEQKTETLCFLMVIVMIVFYDIDDNIYNDDDYDDVDDLHLRILSA